MLTTLTGTRNSIHHRMRIILFCKGKRGLVCLQKLQQEKQSVLLVVCQQSDPCLHSFKGFAKESNSEIFCPADPNEASAINKLESVNADLFILAGYGMILRESCLSIPKINCINLHGGKLPEYRGSSPMNWALINGEKEIGISVIEVDSGIDTGNVLAECSKKIDLNTNIAKLHEWANEKFPELLQSVITKIKKGSLVLRKQDESLACYYPRRFAEDGFILWDQTNCIDAHNKIRALTEPYPCAYSYLGNRKIKFISSRIPESSFRGEAGRIYRKSNGWFLIGTQDQALWITKALFTDDESSAYAQLNVYDRLSTIHQFAELHLNRNENR
jgi:methionyl-tRNA formyltransferase